MRYCTQKQLKKFKYRVCVVSGAFLAFIFASKVFAEGYHYLGYGIGESRVEPNTENSIGLDVNDNSDSAYRFYTGYQSSSGLGVEMEFVELGQALIEHKYSDFSGEIDYSFIGVSGVYVQNISESVEVYGKLGFGKLKNKSRGDVEYKQLNDSQVYYGVGLKAPITEDYYLNAEFAQYDADASAMMLNLETRWSNKELMTKALKEVIEEDENADDDMD